MLTGVHDDPTSKPHLPNWAKFALSLLVAAGLLGVLFWRMDARTLARTLRAADGWWMLAAAGVAAIYWLVRTARWRWMTRLASAPVSWSVAWQSMLAGLGIGLLTPMRGGEIVRPLFVPPGRGRNSWATWCWRSASTSAPCSCWRRPAWCGWWRPGR